MKKIIFHIPNKIDENLASGSQIRPIKILQAFKNIGYEVDVIMGYAKDRKKQIKAIKQKIKNGTKYDFLYSESSTMPTALTEKHHLPTSVFLDFNFFKFCRKNNIKIGLFYRDIYWLFEEYNHSTSTLKALVAKIFYKYDLRQYTKLVDVLYLPSIEMFKYIPINFKKSVIALPPAVELKEDLDTNRTNNKLNFIYVGGTGELYDLNIFFKIIGQNDNLIFNLCTREKDWVNSNMNYPIKKNIIIHHKSGKELEELYRCSDLAVYFIKPSDLWTFAMGVKLFEYISYKKPILAVKNTAVGSFVEKHNIGWAIDYSENALHEFLTRLENNPDIIKDKILNIEKIIPKNTWEARANQVAKDLSL